MKSQNSRTNFHSIESVPPEYNGPLSIGLADSDKKLMASFYAAVESKDVSSRALDLTTSMIEMNSASYTAWFWRRRCLDELSTPADRVDSELDFVDSWCTRNPKNYQVWYHRRWIIESLCEHDFDRASQLLPGELRMLEERMTAEPKHYNAWTHRVFLATRFGLFETLSELEFTDSMLQRDHRNNSAWSHRRNSLSFHPHLIPNDIEYVLNIIQQSPSNESAWVYLRSLDHWWEHPEVRKELEKVGSESSSSYRSSRDAVETLAIFRKITGMHTAASDTLIELAQSDFIREKNLRSRAGDWLRQG